MTTESLIVRRLYRCYDPTPLFGVTIENVLGSPPIHDFVDEDTRRRHPSYHAGRIRFFYELLRKGRAIDPIEVDNRVSAPMGGIPVWGAPFVLDGHHRFLAAVYAGKRRILMQYSGLERIEKWLTGETRAIPRECYR